MTVIDYQNAHNILVKFQNGSIVKSTLQGFKDGSIKQPENREGLFFVTNEQCKIKIVKYSSFSDVVVEFQDKWKYKMKTSWQKVKDGSLKNPYSPNKYGGIVGTNIDIDEDDAFLISYSKEYNWWYNILIRSCDDNFKNNNYTYNNCAIDKEWLYFWNFYKWCKSQENYHKCDDGSQWAIDKDIIEKGNKIYSKDTCFIVPKNINNLLLKHDKRRGEYPIGVTRRKSDGMYEAQCSNPIIDRYVTIGLYTTPEEAFYEYKRYKEKVIKKISKIEYDNGNITEKCYLALLKYKVEISD